MSRRDAAFSPREPEAGAPVFAEPWHAETLAIANALTRAGLFSAAEWAEALGAAIAAADKRGEAGGDAAYYGAALAALEGLVAARAPEAGVALAGRVEAWRRAYLNTPHGKPVELAAADGPPLDRHGHDHHHHHHGHDHHHHHDH